MRLAILIVFCLVVVGGVVFFVFEYRHDQKCKEFEKRFEKMKGFPPDKTIDFILEKFQDSTSPMYRYPIELRSSLLQNCYKTASEDLTELIVEILIYKDMIKTKDPKEYQFIEIIDEIRTNPNERLNKIIIEAFELSSLYQSQRLNFIYMDAIQH
jgi:hypothetical protein